MYDVCVIGAGVAGLQAAISAASDGLSVVVIEASEPGGQIGQTPRFENFVLASGQSGPELVASMVGVAERFGVDFVKGTAYSLSGTAADGFSVRWERQVKPGKMDVNDEVGRIECRNVVLAMGKSWRPVDVPGVKRALAEGRASYGPKRAVLNVWTHTDQAVLYGGGPAAGQAAIVLAERGVQVTIICRSAPSMPQYLLDSIAALETITVVPESDLLGVELSPDGRMRVVTDRHNIGATHLFLCAGQVPSTGWLKGSGVDLDSDGYVAMRRKQTGSNIVGVYAIGDCRQGAAHRVGSAVGDGSMAIHQIWRQTVGPVSSAPTPRESEETCPTYA